MKRLLTLLFVFALFPPAAPAATLLVLPDGLGEFPTIQAAVDGSAAGDTIILASGRYTGPGNRDVNLRGRALWLRSIHLNPLDCVMDCEGAGRGFYAAGGEGPQTIIQGITVANGYSTSGGGAYILSSSPTFIACVFKDCRAYYGGAVYT